MGLWGWIKSAASSVVNTAKDCGKAIGKAMGKIADWVDETIVTPTAEKAFEVIETLGPIVFSGPAEAIANARRKVTEEIRKDFGVKFDKIQNNALEQYERELEHIKDQYGELLPDLDFTRVDYEYGKAREKCEMAREEAIRKATSFSENMGYMDLFTTAIGTGRTEAIRKFKSNLEKEIGGKLRNDLADLIENQTKLIGEAVDKAAQKVKDGLEREKGELMKLLAEKNGTLNEESSVVGYAETTRLCCELALEILDEAEVA